MAPRISKSDRFDYGPDPLEGHTLDSVIHMALGRAKDCADLGELGESATWSSLAQAAATFHLSITIQQNGPAGSHIQHQFPH